MPATKPQRPPARQVLSIPSVDDDPTKRALTAIADAIRDLQARVAKLENP